MALVVEMKGIKKSFGANYVLKGVDFNVEKGSIHALLGENGAGKSTLMNILGGVIQRDDGKILIDGTELEPSTGAKLIQDNVAFIHQELSLVNDLNIFENLYLGKELKKGLFLDKKTMCQQTKMVLDRMGVDIDPYTLVSELNPSYKQISEIARALLSDAKVIIMDEPTSSLTDMETALIFEVMRTLRDQGISLIFISHKLNEVITICDSYTILRNGDVVAVGKIEDGITEKSLSMHMVGEEVRTEGIYQSRELGDVILELENLSRGREYNAVNLKLHKGEILGVTGLLGDGRSELFASVCGANFPYEGKILANGEEKKMKNTHIAMKNRIAYVPKNRKENGIVPDLNIKENLVLPIMNKIASAGLLRSKTVEDVTSSYVKKLDIKVENTRNLITSLSGGNQQKVVISKALCTEPQVLVLDNPTQGVDIGAKMEIYRQIVALAAQGYSFVVLSNEVPELQRTCDRAYVMFQGEIRQELSRDEMTEENIMLVATGGKMRDQ